MKGEFAERFTTDIEKVTCMPGTKCNALTIIILYAFNDEGGSMKKAVQ